MWQRLKILFLIGTFLILFACFLFFSSATSVFAPEWLQTVAREIQAACRDAGTQWMVVVCLVSYLGTFFFLEKRADRSWKLGVGISDSGREPKGEDRVPRGTENQSAQPGTKVKLPTSNAQRSTSKDAVLPSSILNPPSSSCPHSISYLLTSISSPNFWLIVFISLVLLRYVFDYSNAAKSLQVVVLLTGIVVGKGIALWAGWTKSRGTKVESREPEQVGRVTPCAPSPINHPLSTINTPATFNLQPSTFNRTQVILSIFVILLAFAALWHPERGMEFQYRGQQRWTGPWDNPNTYGILMGVGTILAVGLLVERCRLQVAGWRNAERGARATPVPEPSTFNLQPSTSRAAHWLTLTFYFCAAALCAYGLLKSYSRGAWIGTAISLVFLAWRFFNHEIHQTHEKRTQRKLSTLNAQRSSRGSKVESREPDAVGSDTPCAPSPINHPLSTINTPATFNLQPSTTSRLSCHSCISWLKMNLASVVLLLVSLVVISFWQFRHTESPLARRVFSVGNPNDFSWRNRVAAWQGAGRMMMDKPFVGFGWGKAEEIYGKEYRPARLEESAAIQLNDYLMIGISAGVPALACLIAYLWLVLRRGTSGTTPHPSPLPERGGEGVETLNAQISSRGSKVEGREPDRLSTINFQLSTTAAAGAAVLLIGFWFDGGLFKLPTCVVFWVLIELARQGGSTTKYTKHTNAEGGASVLASRLVSSLAPPEQPDAHGVTPTTINSQLSTINFLTRCLAGIAAALAVAQTALHLGVPQLAVSERTLNIARKYLVPPKEKGDFEFLAKMFQTGITNPLSRPTTTLSPSDGERDGVETKRP